MTLEERRKLLLEFGRKSQNREDDTEAQLDDVPDEALFAELKRRMSK